MWTHPKDSLFTSQWIPSPSPEENVGLPTGHNSVWVSGMELHSQDHLISGLKQHQSEPVNTHHQLLYCYYYWTSFILRNLSIKVDIIIKFNVEIWRKTKEIKNLITLISAIFDFFCQSHTVNMWSLQSSITLKWWPESWKRVRQKENL